MKDFGRDLLQAIHANDMNNATFAEKLGLSDTIISQWVKGVKFPGAKRWKLIKMYTNINPQDYVDYGEGRAVDSQHIVASGNASVTVANKSHNVSNVYELSEKEMELIDKLREIGMAIVYDRCLEYIAQVKEKIDSLEL